VWCSAFAIVEEALRDEAFGILEAILIIVGGVGILKARCLQYGADKKVEQ
jgi:hypothetical protein